MHDMLQPLQEPKSSEAVKHKLAAVQASPTFAKLLKALLRTRQEERITVVDALNQLPFQGIQH